MRKASFAVLFLTLLACNGDGPTTPRATTIASGRWTGDGACVLVANESTVPRQIRVTAGCGQGVFAFPVVRSDGTFDADGTYGIVAGPTRQDPLPPAHYSGRLTSSGMTLAVTPSLSTIPPLAWKLEMAAGSSCPTPCL